MPTTAHRVVPGGPLTRSVATATGLVAAGGLAIELIHARSHAPAVEWLVGLLSLSYEQNLPTWYASCLLFSCAVLLTVIVRRAPGDRLRWGLLAAIFYYMSLDETAELHEQLGGTFETGGLLYFDWVIPAALAVAVIGLFYLPFVLRLPEPTRRRIVIAGVLYVGGALLMELPLGYWTERAGSDNLTYAVIDWVEESLELAGASLLLLTLWSHANVDASAS
jgi:hypothetical protein